MQRGPCDRPFTRRGAAACVSVLLLAACGGGGGGGSSSAPPPATVSPPAAPTLAVSPAIKSLVFDWAAVPQASHYRLFETLQGSSEVQLGADIAAGTTQYTHTVPLWSRRDAAYRLQACNTAGCTASATQTWTTALRNAAIGYVKASNTEAQDQFGRTVALSADGRTLAVGAPGEDSNAVGVDGQASNNSASNAGAVYVYIRTGSQWVFQAYLKASNTNGDDIFGSALSLSADGNTLVVGAPLEDSDAIGTNGNALSNAAPSSGAAYVFQRSGGTWSQTHYVKASNTAAGAQFGSSVAISGDGNWLVVGARGESGQATGVNGVPVNVNATASGAAYVWQRTNTGWILRAYLKANQATPFDNFGRSVAVSNDGSRVAVGASGEDGSATGVGGAVDNLIADSGAVFLFARNGSAWSPEAYVKASNPGDSDFFGAGLALSGDGATLAVGAYGEDSQAVGVNGDQADNSMASSGAVYLFDLQNGLWAQRAYVKASNNRLNTAFGFAVSLSNDGRLLAVGAYGEANAGLGFGGNPLDNDGSASISGAVYLLERQINSWLFRHYLKAPNANAGDEFGYTVALSSDGSALVAGATGEASNATGVGTGNLNDGSAPGAGAVYLY